MKRASKDLVHLKRKVFFNLDQTFIDWDRGRPKVFIESDWIAPFKAFDEISSAFKADLWLNGRLSHSNGKLVDSPFKYMCRGIYQEDVYAPLQPYFYSWVAAVEFEKVTGRRRGEMARYLLGDIPLDYADDALQEVRIRLEALFSSDNDIKDIREFARLLARHKSGNKVFPYMLGMPFHIERPPDSVAMEELAEWSHFIMFG